MKKLNDHIQKDKNSLKLLLSSQTYQEFLIAYFGLSRKITSTFSYQQFAFKAGLSKSLIKGILDGKKKITPKTFPLIRKVLDLPSFIDEFFFYLVATSEPKVLSSVMPIEKLQELALKYSNLALENFNNESATEDLFESFSTPYIYSALGSFEKGASTEEIIERTNLGKEEIVFCLEQMIKKKIVFKTDNRYLANRQFLFVEDSKAGSSFQNFYINQLESQRKKALQDFESQENLFYLNVLSVNREDLPMLKKELVKVFNHFVQKAESPDGNKVVSIQLSLI